MSDTRKDKRAPVSLKVRFKSATVDEFIEHYCKDVSRGGIFIKSSQPMPVGTLLKFQFQLKDESQLIKGVGRVVWTRSEDRAGPDRPAGMGIKFIKMDNESRVMVDRIIAASEGSAGAYEEGRENVSVDSVTPPPGAASSDGGGFFPDAGPAELPPPEDRTAVRQAAEFLAAAFSEVSDEAAAREAEQKAEEARVRTKQIEAQRVAEAEQQQRKSAEALPSMIIDPGLSVPPARRSDRPAAGEVKAPEDPSPTADAKKPSLPPPAKVALPPVAPAAPLPSPVMRVESSLPPPPPGTEKRSPLLPILAIAAVLGVAAFVAMRGGPEANTETPASAVEPPKAAEPAAQPAPAPEPPPAEPTPAPAEPTPEPAPEVVAEPAAPVETVAIRVSTQPPGAEVSVGGVAKGVAPVVLDLEKGKPVTISAGLATYATASQELTPEAAKTVRFALKVLPFVLHVETTPPGATVIAGGKRGVSPVDLSFPVPPKTALKASAKLAGYQNADATVALDAFTQTEDAMRGSVQLTLEAVPEKPVVAPTPAAPVAPKPVAPAPAKPKPAAVAKPKPEAAPAGEAPAPAEAKPEEPKPEPAPAPKAEEPKPEPAPAPKVDEPKPEPPKAEPKPEPKPEVPDNPFG
ncbi:MAG: TIGR02266 family protein [Myxococcales bacterium]